MFLLPAASRATGDGGLLRGDHLLRCWADIRKGFRCGNKVDPESELGLCAEHIEQFIEESK